MEKSPKKKKIWRIIIFDILMIIILLINLIWIIFDWIFKIQSVSLFFYENTPAFFEVYFHIHQNFFYYDLIFVSIFVTELIIRWIIAIVKKTYYKWFFYPVIHFYDVLGCIPAGGWIIFRFLRIIAIVYRLNKLEIIDITKSYIFKKLNKYYHILVEEISDRVVLNVLDGIQNEATSGTPVVQKIIEEVFRPNKHLITNLIAEKIKTISQNIHSIHKDELDVYIQEKVNLAFDKNQEIKLIEKVPVIGSGINKTLKKSIYDIVSNIIDSIIIDLYKTENKGKINEISGDIFDKIWIESDDELNQLIEKIIIESVEIIKEKVKTQQWKLKEIALKEAELMKSNDKDREKKMEELEKQKKEAKINDPLFKIKK